MVHTINTYGMVVLLTLVLSAVTDGVGDGGGRLDRKSQRSAGRRSRNYSDTYLPYCTSNQDIVQNDSMFANSVRESDYVFTGRVNSDVVFAVSGKSVTFGVSVKRVIKGAVGDDVKLRLTLDGNGNGTKGEGTKCKLAIRKRYPGVFLAKKTQDPQVDGAALELSLRPVPFTLRNLDIINAAVKDVNYKPRQPIAEELNDPCREKLCGYGSRCVPSPDGRNATCQCPERCPTYGDHSDSRPVCGSDGQDYQDQCKLRKAACQSNSNTTVKFSGKCDPCADTVCSEPEVCQLDENREPVCRCGDSCPLEFIPVCGSDGKTYSNECSLRQEACRTRKLLRIIYRGKCSSGVNPCLSVRCIMGEECAINKFGIARCECPVDCEPVMRPVCSKDSRTFPSECDMRRVACTSRTLIEMAYSGICGELGPCSEETCHYGALCVERSGQAQCECPVCSAEFNPVCGSDGISYGNECKLRLEACKHRRDITVLYEGPCNGCENKKCDFYSTCESEGTTEGHCVCPQSCEDGKSDDVPVCGTDGITYGSECQLRMASCKTKQYVLVAYKGDCDMCQSVNCKFGARCEAGECVCPTDCDESGNEPVCASTMVTYPNECKLQQAACRLPPDAPPLNVVFYGDCRERFAVAEDLTTLPPETSYPSTSGGTSDNRIAVVAAGAVEREACRDIHCDFEATCELGPDNFPRCTCQFDCTSPSVRATSKPVCASDLRTYPSLCVMKMEACQRQEELRLRPLDLCQGMEVKPCNGETPLRHSVTDKELDCGNGPARQDCPSGSYCHQTTRFAKCCLKDQNLVQKGCQNSWFGCCPDGKTPAQGADFAGCPSLCTCNKLGSYSDTCEPETRQCHCKPGVGGLKCDRCEPGYWGLPKISSGHQGCIPCGCSVFGSVREDCEQMTGRCVCKPGIQGQKCTICTSLNKILSLNGCVSMDSSTPPPTSCKELTCYFGSTCQERAGFPMCDCHTDCSKNTDAQLAVCGSDGQTYSSECQLRSIACSLQKDIVVQAFGNCKEGSFTGTDWPIRRYTPLQFTQQDDSNSPLSKSTRHLMVPDSRFYYERGSSLIRPAIGRLPEHLSSKLNRLPYNRHDSVFHVNGDNIAAAAYRPTPATVRVVTALLGDLCSDNFDCTIMNSMCVGGACTCMPEHSESPDRQECIGKEMMTTNPTAQYRSCMSSPCYLGSTCIDLPAATFLCVCGSNSTGPLCETEVVFKQYDVPSFDGHSFVKLRPMRAYHKLSVEIEFKTYANDGILMYNQQNADGTGDFVSLAIVKGFVEFRYNLGNGPVIITSLDKTHKNKLHKVVIKRYHRDGMLKLDDGEDVVGQSRGSLKALDLVEDAFIGYVPTNVTRVFENIGTDRGLVGCISKVKLGRRVVELHENRDDMVVSASGVRDCGDNPCTAMPCRNEGSCRAVDTDMYTCECKPNFYGDVCENAVNPCLSNPCKQGSTCEHVKNGKFLCHCPPDRTGVTCEQIDKDMLNSVIPEFNGTSFVQLPRLDSAGKAFEIDVWFMTKAANGLILYNGQMKNGRGDFISLLLVHSRVQFRFNLGSGIANITSKEPVKLGEWHWVKIRRYGKQGSLQVNNSTVVTGTSGPPLTELNLELPFYIGSVPIWSEIHRLSGASKGFRGAIQRLLINGKTIPILGRLQNCPPKPSNVSVCASGVTRFDGPPCPVSENPCLNSGVCLPHFNSYVCNCPQGYEGTNCESHKIVSTIDWPLKFVGGTFLQYRNRGIRRRKGERGNRYEIKFRTFSANGLLLWRSKKKNLKADYLSIAIVDGYPELSYNLGRQNSFWAIRSNMRVNDGEWHTIHVRRRKRMGFIAVDDTLPVRGVSNSGAIELSTNAKLWIGGSPSIPSGFPAAYYDGFRGCIQHIQINSKPLNLSRPTDGSVLHYCHDNDI